MTKINKLVLHGFKSFAKHTELIFGNKFNCVLGPNGSGKSNILDALCFVLGKSSAKALRSEKSANLIYNGGKSKKPAKNAEVSIYFDNNNKVFPTEDAEVKVSRIVRQSGQSVYKINDETRTRQQVIELLSLAKINPDAYNIILQGDIVRFVEMSGEERRQLVEEISGISVYEEKKQKAVNELNKVEEKLREADIILSERKERLKELRKERDQALKYKDAQDKIKSYKASFIYRQIERKKKEKEEFEKRINKYKGILNKKRKEINELKNLIMDLKNETEKINKEIEEKGEKEQVELHKEVEKLKVNLATSKNKISSYKNEISKMGSRKEQLNQNLNEISEKIKKLEEEKEDFENIIKQKESELKEIDSRIEEFKKKHKLEDANEIEKSIDELDKNAEDQQNRIQLLRQEQQELLRKKDKLEFQINSIDEKMEKVLSIEKENKEQIETLKQKKEGFKKSTLELSQLLNEDSSLGAQLSNARKSLLNANEQLAKLRAKNYGVQEMLLTTIAVKKILENKSRFKGVYGTVSELGEVDTKYSLALEVGAGPKIKGIVVENDKVAADCIKFLKENRYGVATFLPLNKIKPVQIKPEIKALTKSKGAHDLAVNLINYEPKFKNIFSYVFGNTLIVDDIDAARRIGVGNVKMVTLDGDLSEISGAMKGGYRQKKKQGFAFQEKEIAADIKKYENEVDNYSSTISNLEKKKKEVEERITSLRQLKANLEGEVIKIEKSLHLESADLDASKKEKASLRTEIKNIEKELDKTQEKISGLNNELADNKMKKQELRSKVNELRSPTLIAELNAFEEKKKELKESVTNTKLNIKNLESQETNILLPEKENILKIIKQQDKENSEFNNEIKAVKKDIASMESSLKEKEKAEKRFYEQFKGLFNKRTKISEEIAKKEKRVEVFLEQEREADHKNNAVCLEEAKIKAELSALEEDFEQFKGVEINKTKTEQELKMEVSRYEATITRMGSINMRALEVYDSVEKEYNELTEKKEKLLLEKDDVLVMMNEIEAKKEDLFMNTFNVINNQFKSAFTALSTKGDASLVLEDTKKPLEGGLLIKVRITGERFLDIRSLSGGEKTLTALAFIFAIQENDPASFYVLDEVDAALDKKNSEKLSHLIKKYSDKAQYVMISHNDSLITEADSLYGVSMDEHGISNVVSLKI